MWIHCLTVAGLCAEAACLSLTCAVCGMRTELLIEHLTEKFGEGCTVGEVIRRARCRECGGWVTVSPNWDD